MKYFLSLLTCLIICQVSFCQNTIKADQEYAEAEKSWYVGKYKDAIARLKEVETLLAKRTIKTSYLLTMVLNRTTNFYDVTNADNQLMRACIDFYIDYAKKHPNEIDKAKLIDVQALDESIKKVEIAKAEQNKKDIKAFEAFRKKKEFFAGMKEYKDSKEAYQLKKYTQAMELMKTAAAKGNPLAEEEIGIMYGLGKGVTENADEAVMWFNRAVDNGNMDALFWLSASYDYSYEETKYQEKPYFNTLLRGADAGCERCYSFLASAYSIGTGTTEDYSRAVYWYKKDAEKGDYLAMENIAQLYYKGGKNLPQSKEEAFKWYMKAATLNSDNEKPFPGSRRAMYQLYTMYYTGEGIEKNPSEGFNWLLKLATIKENQDGYEYEWIGQAYYELGNTYYAGTLVPQNYTEALKWFIMGAEMKANVKPMIQENKDCMEKIAIMYRDGLGVKKDLKIAEEWQKKSEAIR